MSAIASFTVVDRSRVPEMARLARESASALRAYLSEHGRDPGARYDWSGFCLVDLLDYLEERGVDLEESEFAAEAIALNEVDDLTVLITSAHRRFLDRLDPAGHREEELSAHFEELGNGFEESGRAGLDGLKLLHDTISRLRDDEVLLLHVG
ncbi:hypothetical protein [Micromonospora sp. CPCC 205556]|uniref:hypothetical protein n=1 Tax=Micromonospora sp. CPCC 205556 TaxID=3122398 RepID=UPI002FF3B74A